MLRDRFADQRWLQLCHPMTLNPATTSGDAAVQVRVYFRALNGHQTTLVAVTSCDIDLLVTVKVFLTLQVTTAQNAHVMQFMSGNDVSQRTNADLILVCLSVS
jgi:hypothetical protein